MTASTPQTIVSGEPAGQLRQAMVDQLKDAYPRQISAGIEQALRVVPRHLFCPPDTTLEAAYANGVVLTRHDATGRATSSVSAPWLQARMLHQAEIEPGMRVLEVGSGGYNAALIAELVGPTGYVVTVDIDPVVIEATQAALARTGYTDRVTAVLADATEPLALGRFDRIVVTVGVWDIAPAWISALVEDGILVVPLRARHSSECWSIPFRREGELLVGQSAMVCGFVDVQGATAPQPTTAQLRGAHGGVITARSWDHDTDLSLLPDVLPDQRVVEASGVVMPPPGMFVGLRTRLAYDLPGLADLTYTDRELLQDDTWRWMHIGHVDGDSFAVLCIQPPGADGGSELGAIGFGPRAERAALTIVDHIADWGRDGMPQRAAHTYRPAHAKTPPLRGRVLSLPLGDLAVTQHHDGTEDI
ncbi:methyltransferase, FxLD system [Promicromonospora sp. MS192]|uniref:methyltransferase, FxLD system n=1 Tax=Promicromonospora sp. MS192 TaxID=3412684 RepID=UPI003C2BFD59